VQKVNAIVLSGGSAFGLDAASGVVRWLDEHDFGYDCDQPCGGKRIGFCDTALRRHCRSHFCDSARGQEPR